MAEKTKIYKKYDPVHAVHKRHFKIRQKMMEKERIANYRICVHIKGKLQRLCSYQTEFTLMHQIVARDEEVYFIMQKGSVHQKDTVIINTYPCNNRASKYMKDRQP